MQINATSKIFTISPHKIINIFLCTEDFLNIAVVFNYFCTLIFTSLSGISIISLSFTVNFSK